MILMGLAVICLGIIVYYFKAKTKNDWPFEEGDKSIN
jgi:hypothetical protein